MDSLYKHVPQSLLPQEYGGEAGSLDKLAGMPDIYQIFSLYQNVQFLYPVTKNGTYPEVTCPLHMLATCLSIKILTGLTATGNVTQIKRFVICFSQRFQIQGSLFGVCFGTCDTFFFCQWSASEVRQTRTL